MNNKQVVSNEYRDKSSGLLDSALDRMYSRNTTGVALENASRVEKIYNNIAKAVKDLNIETKSVSKLLIDMERTSESIEKDRKSGSQSEESLIKNTLGFYKDLLKIQKEITYEKEKQGKRSKQDLLDLDTYQEQVELLERSLKKAQEGQKTFLTGLTESMSKFKTELRDLAIVNGLDKVQQAMTSNDPTSMLSVRNRTVSQLGISNGQFESFKNSLIGSIDTLRYNWKDTATYLNNLDKLGITNMEMAEDQYLAILQGTKYLGQSVETQAAILKNARQTGNINLLAETNENMVKIMNAQLGVSKEQLDKLTQSAASLGSLTALTGIDSTGAFQMQLGAVTSKYGEGAATALSNIASQMLTGNTTYAAYLGSNYQSIMQDLQNGNSNALINLYEALQASQYLQAQSSNPYIRGEIGSDLLTIATAGSQRDESLSSLLKQANESDGDILKFIGDIQETLKEKLENFGSNVAALFPSWLSLANAFYIASGAYYVAQFARDIEKIGLLKTIAINTSISSKSGEKIAEGLTGSGGTGSSSLLGGLKNFFTSGLGRTIQGIGGAVFTIADGISAMQNQEAYGTKTGFGAFLAGAVGGSAEGGVGNAFKNALKWALIGGSIAPGWGHLIGGLLGFTLGMMGGKALASWNPLDRAGAVGGALVGGVPGMILGATAQNYVNKAEGDSPDGITGTSSKETPNYNSTSSWPWKISSNWGPRKPFKTTNGATTSKFHGGTDFAIRTGTGLGANHGGIVAAVGKQSALGNYVTIKGDHGLYERYQHLNNENPLVSIGQRVEQGELIGYSGATGNVTGPHLHFQEQKTLAGTPKDTNTVDARPYITAGLFAQAGNYNASGFVPYTGEDRQADTESSMRYGKLLQSIVDANTLEAVAESNALGDDGIRTSVDNGFDRLIEKIDSLSNRQDAQEEMLKAISAGTSNALYRF